MKFEKYQHVERLGQSAVEGILDGEVWIFPKLDGTNASVWLEDGEVCAGSRNRKLSLESDNAGFCAFVKAHEKEFMAFFDIYPNYRLYGEWLVPHTVKTYRDDAWRNFYVFDVCHAEGELQYHIPHKNYKHALESLECVKVLNPIARGVNLRPEQIISIASTDTTLIKDGLGQGEGVVVKNYEFRNKFGRTVWAKVVNNSFKEQHKDTMGVPVLGEKKTDEHKAIRLLTDHLILKEQARIVNVEGEWHPRFLPQLFGRVWHAFLTEELPDFIKSNKRSNLDFAKLLNLVQAAVKRVVL